MQFSPECITRSKGEHHRPRRLADAPEEGRKQARLPETHYVVDGGKARVILDALVTPAEVNENLPMLGFLFRSRFRWRLHPRSVTGDAAYGTRENVAAIEQADIRAYTALPEPVKRTSLCTIEEFVYDAQKDLYTCPRGEILHRLGHDHKGGYVRYGAKPSSCNECPSRASTRRVRRDAG
jgi:hypothetical protein